ncbi:MAG: fibronectin type III domain-containing protein [Oscillospiraceae bacterium]|nr:fibronectin type III domain-containing protein [Oscillospiraceae bacterium]
MKKREKKANTLKRIMAIILAMVMMSSFTVTLADYSEVCDVCGELEDSCVCASAGGVEPTAQAEQCPICGIALVDSTCSDCDPTGGSASCPICGALDCDDCNTTPAADIIITSINPINAELLNQTHFIGTKLEALNLPETVTGIYGGGEVEIPISWLGSYDPAVAKTYTFRPAPLNAAPDGYVFDIDVTKPITSTQIKVTLKDSVQNLDELKQALEIINDSDLAQATILLKNDDAYYHYSIHGDEPYILESKVPITLTVGERPMIYGEQYKKHFQVDRGTLIMGDGITLTREEGYTGVGGGVYLATEGTFIMNGGEISGNRYHFGGGVTLNAGGTKFEMNGGIISDNEAFSHVGGGGVYVCDSGEFYMNGGTITRNSAGKGETVAPVIFKNNWNNPFEPEQFHYGGGAIRLDGYFEMTGGEISENYAYGHGGAIVHTSHPGYDTPKPMVINPAPGSTIVFRDNESAQGTFMVKNDGSKITFGSTYDRQTVDFFDHFYTGQISRDLDGKWTNGLQYGYNNHDISFLSAAADLDNNYEKETVYEIARIEDYDSTRSLYIGADIGNKLELPAVLIGIDAIGGDQIEIPVTWQSADFDKATAGIYTFTAKFPQIGYEFAASISAPQISVTIKDTVADLNELTEALETIDGSTLAAATLKLTALLTIAEGASYELKSDKDVTLTVNANRRHFSVRGTLTMGDGITLTRAADLIAAGTHGGGVVVENVNGKFIMNGGTITGNSNSNSGGGGVYNSGTFIMTGGVISGNKAENSGGGVYNMSGTFNMSGGEISDNTAANFGGGVAVLSQGTFNMTGGEISYNTAAGAGGGGIQSNNPASSTVNIHGGKIIGNRSESTTAGHGGGAIRAWGVLNITGGEISGNYAAGHGGAIIVPNDSRTSIDNVSIGPDAVFNDNESALGIYMIKEGTDLFRTYREYISADLDGKWSGGLKYGYNNHDIGAAFNATDLADNFSDYDHLEAPGKPVITDATSDDDGKITVKWEAPTTGGEVEVYDIIITDEDGNENKYTVGGDVTEFVTGELKDGSYKIIVRARNAKGTADSDEAEVEVEKVHTDNCDCDDCKDCDCDADCAGDCDCDDCNPGVEDDGADNGNNGNNNGKDNGEVSKKSDVNDDKDNSNDAANSDGQDQNKAQSQDDTDSLVTDSEEGNGSQTTAQPGTEAATAGTPGTTPEPTPEPTAEPTPRPKFEMTPEPTPDRPQPDDGFVGSNDEQVSSNNPETPYANIGARINTGTGYLTIANLILALLGVLLIPIVSLNALISKRGKKDKKANLLGAIILSAAGAILFWLTQDMNGQIILTDVWTIAHSAILALEAAVIIIRRKEKTLSK